MSDLTMTKGVAFNTDKAVTIQSDSNGDLTDDECFTLTRGKEFTEAFYTVTKGSVTVTNLVLDGGAVWNEHGPSGGLDGNGAGNNNTTPDIHATNALIYISGSGEATLAKGAILQNNQNRTTNNEPYFGGAVTINGGALTIQNNAIIRNNYSPRFGSAIHTGYSADSTLTIKDTALITGNVSGADGAAITSKKCVLTMSGGTITGNKALGRVVYEGSTLVRNDGSGGISFVESAGSITMSGTVNISENYQYQSGIPVLRNVLLNKDRTITVGAEGLDPASRIGFYTTATAAELAAKDVKFATNAEESELVNFISDNTAFAGTLWCNGKSDDTHADTHITTTKHTPEAKTLWLSVDARIQADIEVGMDQSGNLTLEAHELDPSKFYTVLDRNGVAVDLTLEEGTEVANSQGWCKPTANGDLVWSGLDPENGPYQVVTSDSTEEAPAVTDTKVGGQIMALYVAGAAGGTGGKAWAAGNDTSGDGTRATPFLSLTKAYAVLDEKYAQAGIITVLSDIEQSKTLTFKPTTGAVILGEGEHVTVKRADAFTSGHMFIASGDLAIRNLTLDGNKEKGTQGALIYINSAEGNVLLSQDVVLQNNNGGQNYGGNSAGAVTVVRGTLTMEKNATIKNCIVNNYASAVLVGAGNGGGIFEMKDTASITGCELTTGARARWKPLPPVALTASCAFPAYGRTNSWAAATRSRPNPSRLRVYIRMKIWMDSATFVAQLCSPPPAPATLPVLASPSYSLVDFSGVKTHTIFTGATWNASEEEAGRVVALWTVCEQGSDAPIDQGEQNVMQYSTGIEVSNLTVGVNYTITVTLIYRVEGADYPIAGIAQATADFTASDASAT